MSTPNPHAPLLSAMGYKPQREYTAGEQMAGLDEPASQKARPLQEAFAKVLDILHDESSSTGNKELYLSMVSAAEVCRDAVKVIEGKKPAPVVTYYPPKSPVLMPEQVQRVALMAAEMRAHVDRFLGIPSPWPFPTSKVDGI
jgi:hypothetical protein